MEHVTFVEHLQFQPASLLPGTIIAFNPDAPPMWASPPTLTPLAPPESPKQPVIRDPVIPSFPPQINKLPQTAPTRPAPPPTPNPPAPPPPHLSPPAPPPIPPVSAQTNSTTTNNNNNTNTIHTIEPVNNNNNNNTITLPTVQPNINGNNKNNTPTLRRSARLAAQQSNDRNDLHTAFLSEYLPFFDSHDLVDLSFHSSDFESLTAFLSSLSNGSTEPEFDNNDGPSWPAAMHSPEREYWIAGARDKLQSLADLQVFALIPCSQIPQGRRPLKGKLVCKRKRDDTGNVVRYKVRYVAKGYTQRYGVDYDKTTAPTA